ncbi:hypothetical protein V1478_013682 [Vespula squamosa]|uniref:Glucose-methanol-choline oxidoreductase N-terminal domain-containing protein n=1 Tax=Vespula squamosa TaxID=30214 RepID=A0ABD2A5Y6_VESSQ
MKNLLKEYDFIVVGRGSAGSVVVNRLTENAEWSVLLLEARSHETEITDVPSFSLYIQKTKLDWQYRTQAQDSACQAMKDNRCCWPCGKVLSGSSVLNTMLYVRGNRRDFDQWESFANPGWGYDDVLPYFKKPQDQKNPHLARNTKYHSTGGYLTVQNCPYNTPLSLTYLQAAEEHGYKIVDVNGEQQTGFAFFQYTMRKGTRCSAAKAFVRPIKFRKNFHLSLWSHVTRILTDLSTKKAYGVEFIRNGRVETVFAKKEAILSASAINTPQLLMLSGIGARNHLEDLGIPVIQNTPGVGQNLQDHIALGGLIFLIDYQISLKTSILMNLKYLLQYAIYRKGPLTSSVGLEAIGFLSTKYANQTNDRPDIEFVISSGTSKNPLDYPLMYHNYLTNPDDVYVLREGVKAAIPFAETSSMKRLGARFQSTIVPNHCQIDHLSLQLHCENGSMIRSNVVDPSLKVYGVEGLRVIDASIMPTITSGNINAPVIMIGEKGSDLIKKDWLDRQKSSDKTIIASFDER